MSNHQAIEHVDVLVVGAGLSGIGAAATLRQRRPQDTVVVLEARADLGGTWDLFRYPGIRSDSDMYTLGFDFEPWTEAEYIADGPAILSYLRRTAHKHDVHRLIRFRRRVVSAAWSSTDSRWTVEVARLGEGDVVVGTEQMTCRWLHMCTGYYRYDQGYTPSIDGMDDFGGTLVHAQHWPDGLDYSGARVVIIGSGASAVTIAPSMAPAATQVTMLQRSPSYVLAVPSRDRVADVVRHILPERTAHGLLRWKNALLQLGLFHFARRQPDVVRRLLRRQQAHYLSEEQIEEHFTPSYAPWDQRMCFVPNADLLECIRDGSVDVVTDTIDHMDRDGIALSSGRRLDADIVVLATGLRMQFLGGARVRVDGVPVLPHEAVLYKGMAIAGVPNLTFTSGYTNAPWTLKVDLVNGYLVRLLDHLDARGYGTFLPDPPPEGVGRIPLIDLQSGYIRRALDDLPTQGDRFPWRLYQNYPRDVLMLRWGRVEGEGVRFLPRGVPVGEAVPDRSA